MKRLISLFIAGFVLAQPNGIEIIESEGYRYVEVSLKDINRIVCPYEISGVVYSKEKRIQVRVEGKNAYVKFLPLKEGNNLVYEDFPRELYIECGEKVFSLILVPREIPAKTIVLKVPLKDFKKATKFEQDEYLRLLVKLISYAWKEVPPPGYSVKEVGKIYKRFKEARLKLVKVYEGVRFAVLELELSAKEDIFLNPAVLIPYFKKPLAISVVKPSLEKGETTRVFIVVEKDA
ncbi:MAG TPA: hypothetical protein EYH58_02600 [Aquifex aeolicus]|nr:hypothetical protein [Aquifex aeolicus]